MPVRPPIQGNLGASLPASFNFWTSPNGLNQAPVFNIPWLMGQSPGGNGLLPNSPPQGLVPPVQQPPPQQQQPIQMPGMLPPQMQIPPMQQLPPIAPMSQRVGGGGGTRLGRNVRMV